MLYYSMVVDRGRGELSLLSSFISFSFSVQPDSLPLSRPIPLDPRRTIHSPHCSTNLVRLSTVPSYELGISAWLTTVPP